jgi:hypothetical protein
VAVQNKSFISSSSLKAFRGLCRSFRESTDGILTQGPEMEKEQSPSGDALQTVAGMRIDLIHDLWKMGLPVA